jgi:hypothetical protein
VHPFKLSLIDQMKLAREREIVFSKARPIRYYEISQTNSPTTNPLETWFVMTNLPKSWQLQLGKRYSLRGWIEYGFKQVKNEQGKGRFSSH